MGSGKIHNSLNVLWVEGAGANISNMSGLKSTLRTRFLCPLHNITGPTVQVTLNRNHFWHVLVSHFHLLRQNLRGCLVQMLHKFCWHCSTQCSQDRNVLQSQWGCFYNFFFFSFFKEKPKKLHLVQHGHGATLSSIIQVSRCQSGHWKFSNSWAHRNVKSSVVY